MYLRSHKPRFSSPIKDGRSNNTNTFLVDYDDKSSLDDTLMKTGDSTRSLLAPLYDDSFQDTVFKDLPNRHGAAEKCKDDSMGSLLSQSISSICSAGHGGSHSPPSSYTIESTCKGSSSTSLDSESKHSLEAAEEKYIKEESSMSWEQWLQKKMSEDIENLNLKREKRKYKAMEKRKKEDEKKAEMEKSVKQREQWLKRKDSERERKFRQKKVENRQKSLKQDQEKQVIKEKTVAKLCEWEEDKLLKEKEKRKSLLEDKRKKNEEEEKRKEIAEKSYKSWLEKAKSKRSSRTTHGYANGTLFSYYDMGCSPAPSYNNPLPWVGTIPSSKNTEPTVNKTTFMSPPMLWKEVEKRDSKGSKQPKKTKRVIVKHSCIDK